MSAVQGAPEGHGAELLGVSGRGQGRLLCGRGGRGGRGDCVLHDRGGRGDGDEQNVDTQEVQGPGRGHEAAAQDRGDGWKV